MGNPTPNGARPRAPRANNGSRGRDPSRRWVDPKLAADYLELQNLRHREARAPQFHPSFPLRENRCLTWPRYCY
jgi:hypothetical protein